MPLLPIAILATFVLAFLKVFGFLAIGWLIVTLPLVLLLAWLAFWFVLFGGTIALVAMFLSTAAKRRSAWNDRD